MDLIVTHTNADFDALASLVAAKKLYPQSRLVFAGSQERSVREFMTLAKDMVRIENESECSFDGVKRVIVVDTQAISRLGKVGDFIQHHPEVKVCVYDHHPKIALDYKPSHMLCREVGSTTTLLVSLIKQKKIPLTSLEATIMALGIYEDTGSLTYPTTTKLDMDMAGFLLNQGANLSVVSSYLTRELSEDEMLLLTTLLNSTEAHQINGVNVAIAQAIGADFEGDLAVLTHKLLEIENFNVLFTLIKLSHKTQIIGRSRLPSVNVGEVCREMGGGGHHSACSASVPNRPLEEVKQDLIALLRKHIKPAAYARDIMSYPVKTVDVGRRVSDVKNIMVQLNLNGMPVMDKENIAGMVTRHDLDKAIHHGFPHSRVKGYMSCDVRTISPETPVHEIQKIMYDHKIGRLPVVRNKKLVGIVTRTDLLQFIHHELLTPPAASLKEEKKEAPSLEDISRKMRAKLPKNIYALLRGCGRIADGLKYDIYAVGGFVRDLLLGLPNFDVDIVVEGDGIRFGRELCRKFGGRLKTHRHFGTAMLMLADGLRVDLASSRREYYEYPAAPPTVEMSSIKQDLLRRDFTINTMAIKLNKSGFGRLIDFFDGMKDLRAKRIRVLHNLSFVEDPTRIFRAVRFEQRLEFHIDRDSEHLIKTAIDLDMFEKVKKQRLREEIVLLLSEPHPGKVLKRMAELHELKFIHPGIRPNKALFNLIDACERVVNWYNITFPRKNIKGWFVFFIALADGLNRRQVEELRERFIFKKKIAQQILHLRRKQKTIFQTLVTASLQDSVIYCRLTGMPDESLLFLMAKAGDDKVKERLSRFLTKLKNVKLEISGEDLKRLGVTPGPRFKNILEKTLWAKLDLKLKTKAAEENFVRKML